MSGNLKRSAEDLSAGQSSRQLQLVRAGSLEFGIFADEVAAIESWRDPTTLPGAPESVLGVVSVQGRMLTVLDLAAFPVGEHGNGEPATSSRQIVALKGDEQLALAVDSVGDVIPFTPENASAELANSSGIVSAVLTRNNAQTHVLNLQQLFLAAIQGRERRRRRF